MALQLAPVSPWIRRASRSSILIVLRLMVYRVSILFVSCQSVMSAGCMSIVGGRGWDVSFGFGGRGGLVALLCCGSGWCPSLSALQVGAFALSFNLVGGWYHSSIGMRDFEMICARSRIVSSISSSVLASSNSCGYVACKRLICTLLLAA